MSPEAKKTFLENEFGSVALISSLRCCGACYVRLHRLPSSGNKIVSQPPSVNNSVQKSGWLRWREWVLSKFGVPFYSGKTFAYRIVYLELAKRSSENIIGVSSIESAVYAIKWGHAMAGIDACPVSHPLEKSALEGTKRRFAQPVQPKEPLSVSIVQAIATHFPSSAHFPIFVFIYSRSFSWFCRLFSH